MQNPVLRIPIGEKGDDLKAQNDLTIDQGSLAGLTFYEVGRIATGTEPRVEIVSGDRTLSLPQATKVFMDEDTDQGWPIGDISVSIKMPDYPGKDASDAAYEEYDRAVYTLYKDIVQRIRAAGYERYYSPREPRLTGAATYFFERAYKKVPIYWEDDETLLIPQDPYYELTFDDWKHLRADPTWTWYAADVFIRLNYSRRYEGVNQGDTFSVDIKNDRTLMIGYDPQQNSDLEAAIENYKNTVPKKYRRRAELEVRARKNGIPIASDYKDPKILGIEVPSYEEWSSH